ncbi:hypothetical protein P12x_006175 (plasmid) [Tundrisphaera lichenicola]|uniref:hypothetical protein n=1 Tax=Tundrisphaera lichenicola TaxID=2029860 RepID=UPI003EBA7801
MLKKTLSILGLASILTGTAFRPGESKALTAGEVSQVRSTATAHDCPRPDRGETKFGPFKTRDQAERKRHSLEREGWRSHIVKCDECRDWYVFARPSRR